MRRVQTVAAAGLALAVLLGACGMHSEVYEVPPEDEASERDVTLPDPIPAVPVFAIRSQRPLPPERTKRLRDIDGVSVVAPGVIRKMKVKGPRGAARLKVLTVEPLRFRSVTPPSTRSAEFVWVSMVIGHAVTTFDAAKKLGLSGAADISVDGTTFRVGAFADNGLPNFADVMIQNGAEKELEGGGSHLYVIGAKSGTVVEHLGQRLRQDLPPGVALERLIPQGQSTARSQHPAASDPAPVGHVEGGVIGAMRFVIMKNGFIRPDPSWVAANIVTAQVPIIGTVTCHKLMIPRLQGALGDVEKAGLAKKIRTGDYGGCYVPRFIDRDPTKPLSMHAFGLAVDLNVSTNGLGTRGDMDPRIVQIFQGWGFTWGGTWSRPDPMHFEL